MLCIYGSGHCYRKVSIDDQMIVRADSHSKIGQATDWLLCGGIRDNLKKKGHGMRMRRVC